MIDDTKTYLRCQAILITKGQAKPFDLKTHVYLDGLPTRHHRPFNAIGRNIDVLIDNCNHFHWPMTCQCCFDGFSSIIFRCFRIFTTAASQPQPPSAAWHQYNPQLQKQLPDGGWRGNPIRSCAQLTRNESMEYYCYDEEHLLLR